MVSAKMGGGSEENISSEERATFSENSKSED
jgi:hypothetical protein